MSRKIKDIWLLIRAKHYAVLTSDSNAEINWALEVLKREHAKDTKERG